MSLLALPAAGRAALVPGRLCQLPGRARVRPSGAGAEGAAAQQSSAGADQGLPEPGHLHRQAAAPVLRQGAGRYVGEMEGGGGCLNGARERLWLKFDGWNCGIRGDDDMFVTECPAPF